MHDAGRYVVDGQRRALEAGMVITVEPDIYIQPGSPYADSSWHGIGVRIEDNILVTESGHRKRITRSIPDASGTCHRPISSLALSIPLESRPNVPVVNLEFDCEWEREHGIQWLVRDGTILFVGAACEGKPWGEYGQYPQWNYALSKR